jgi:hypothetical protein
VAAWHHLWADHFDGSLEDVFDLQHKVASSVTGVIEPTLQAAEIRRSSEDVREIMAQVGSVKAS